MLNPTTDDEATAPSGGQGLPAPETSEANEPVVRLGVSTAVGFGYDGGHTDTDGLDALGNVVVVPRYRHEVSLVLAQFELAATVEFNTGWLLGTRLPFRILDQTARITLVDPATQDEQDAMARLLDIHHRDETYIGPGDVPIFGGFRFRNVFAPTDSLTVRAGFTLPVGDIQPDPYKLGSVGETHLHIQFGNGTIDPQVEFVYRTRIGGGALTASAFVFGQLSLYPNSQGFRGPPLLTAGISGQYEATAQVGIRLAFNTYVQGFAHWSGVRDVNTGFVLLQGEIGLVFTIHGVAIGLDVRLPLFQTILESGDTFAAGLALGLRTVIRL